jgi:membrane protein DedA with SNARE-associated domain
MKNTSRHPYLRWIALGLVVAATLAAILFAMRTYGSYRLLRSATEVGAPSTSAIRGWMTLDYVAGTYGVPVVTLSARLGLPSETAPQTSLKAIADAKGVARLDFVRQVQRAIADTAADQKPAPSSGWLATLGDSVLSVILTFGYAAYGAALFLGALGLPLPSGVAAVVAGTLVAQGRFDLWPAVALGASAAALGDLADYALGRWLGSTLVAKHGPRYGLTAERQKLVGRLLAKWGASTILLSRTLASSLSTLVSVLAGAGKYSLARFVAFVCLGRVLWTLAYVWLGFTIGADVEAAAGLLRNLSGLLLSLLAFAAGVAAWLAASSKRAGAT